MALTDEQKLEQARTALHKLVTGTSKVSVGYGDRRTTYTAANKADLEQYIAELEQLTGDVSTTRRGPPFGVQWS